FSSGACGSGVCGGRLLASTNVYHNDIADEPGLIEISTSVMPAVSTAKSGHATLGQRYSTARVSKRPSHRSAACLRARYCTNLAWFDLVIQAVRFWRQLVHCAYQRPPNVVLLAFVRTEFILSLWRNG